MRPPLLASLALLAILFSGCVDEQAPGAPTAPPEDAPEDGTPDVDLDRLALPVEPGGEPVAVPFATDGASAAGFWVCALAQATGDCTIWWQDTGGHHHDVPHDATVVGVELTVTYTPATPELKGIVMFLSTGNHDEFTLLGVAEGPSGTTLSLRDLNVTTDQPLMLQAWSMPDADVGGPLWLDPVPQPYHIEGTLLVRPT